MKESPKSTPLLLNHDLPKVLKRFGRIYNHFAPNTGAVRL